MRSLTNSCSEPVFLALPTCNFKSCSQTGPVGCMIDQGQKSKRKRAGSLHPSAGVKIMSGYKTAVGGLFLVGIGCALLFHGRAATAADASSIPYTFVTVDVPVPGAGSTMVVGINNLGDMVGSYNFIPGAGALGLRPGSWARGLCGIPMAHSLRSTVRDRSIPNSASPHSLFRTAITSKPGGSTIGAMWLERIHRMC